MQISLDNAIEACEKLPEDQRKVSVKARTDKGLFVMKVQNPYSGKIVWENGIPVTAKKDLEAHGFGLAGIREIAVRYGGGADITEDEGQFALLVYFPFNEKK